MGLTVLHSFPTWLPQTQTWMFNQVRYLPEFVEAHVVCERTENLDQFRVPHMHCYAQAPLWRRLADKALRPVRSRPYARFIDETAQAEGASILHSHFGPIGWNDIEPARRAGLKHVVTFYGQDVSHLPQQFPVWRQRYVELFDSVDTVLCEGRHMASRIHALGCPDRKIQVQRLGIALDDISFRPMAWSPGEPLKVLIAAAFREKKGVQYAFEALARLRDRATLEITLIGDAGPDPRSVVEKARILDAIDRNELRKMTRMLGFQPHARLMEEAHKHHVFLSPSVTAEDGDTEGGAPVSLIEMAAAGLILVSTTHCDIPEIVTHRESGLLAEERDVGGLYENLVWLIEHSELWDQMRGAARRHVERRYDAETQGRSLARIYEALTGLGSA